MCFEYIHFFYVQFLHVTPILFIALFHQSNILFDIFAQLLLVYLYFFLFLKIIIHSQTNNLNID